MGLLDLIHGSNKPQKEERRVKNRRKWHNPDVLVNIAISHVDCEALRLENEELRRENEKLHRQQNHGGN